MTLDPKVSRELARIKQQRLGREAKARGLPAIALVSNASTTNDRPPETALESTKASEFSIRAIRWFWPGRLALGKLGLIGGLPDKGKGLISADIIARCTTGAEWPCNEGRAPEGNVIWFTAEDDIEDTVIPRLVAAGADLKRVHIVGMTKNANGTRMFNLATDLPLLEQKT